MSKEFIYNWLKSTVAADHLRFERECPDQYFIGPHAGEMAIEAFNKLVRALEMLEQVHGHQKNCPLADLSKHGRQQFIREGTLECKCYFDVLTEWVK